MDEPKIKPQFKMFAINYCGKCEGNAEKSAIEAGYSKNYARGNSHKLLKRSDVKEYIAYLNYLTENDPANPSLHIATIEEIKSFWSNVMNDKKRDMKERLRASELLAKVQGAFNNDW